MKKNILLALLTATLLASCEASDVCNHLDENKDHLCDKCNMILSEHKDENKDHYCDYCEDQLNDCLDKDLDGKCDICGKDIELPHEYAEWPTKDIQDLVIVVSGSEVKIPEYNRADDIEVNEDDLVDSGYFSIYCYTENVKSEDEYKEILRDANWEVGEEKDKIGYFSSLDPTHNLNIKFGYIEEYANLEILISKCAPIDWTNEEKNIFSTHIDNYVIPFYFINGNKVEYKNSIDTITVSGGHCTKEDLDNWTSLFISDGFVEESNKDNYHVLFKEIETETSYRRFYIDMAALKSDNSIAIDGSGIFTMYISDTFEYQWNANYFLNLTKKILYSSISVPVFEAKYYTFGDYSTDLGYVEAYCFGNLENSVEIYKNTLKNSGFSVSETKTKDSGYYEAISSDDTFKIMFDKSDEADYFYLLVTENVVWPEIANQAVAALTDESGTVLPSYDGGLYYDFYYEDYATTGYMTVQVGTTNENAAADYAQKLTDAKYSVTYSDGFYKANSEKGDLFVKFQYDESFGLVIMFNDFKSKWPSKDLMAQIKAVLNGKAETEMPVLEGDAYRLASYPEFLKVILKVVGVSTEEFKNYIDLLVYKYFDVYPDNGEYTCIPRDKDYTVLIWQSGDMVQFEFSKYQRESNWPTDQIATVVKNMGLTGEVIPFEGPNYGVEIDTYWSPPSILIYMDDDVKDAAAAAYNQMLLDNGYELAGYLYGDEMYAYPGTTLSYHAVNLGEHCLTIELADRNTLSH